jgi:hypothetical protein
VIGDRVGDDTVAVYLEFKTSILGLYGGDTSMVNIVVKSSSEVKRLGGGYFAGGSRKLSTHACRPSLTGVSKARLDSNV